MSLAHSPSIVLPGLVLCLDAANSKSYPGSGTTWTDLSGNGNNGTLQNGPTYDTNNLGSFSLDGVNNRILISCNNSTIRTFNSTTQFIIKLPVYSGGQRCILSYRTGAGLLYIGKANNGIFCFYNQLSTAAFTVGNIASNATVICTVTCDATNNLLSTYINGTLAGSASRTGWVSTYHTSLYLGWDAGGTNEYMLGNFYQFSHYNRVLTAQEIQQNFNALRSRFSI
jgi:hypothetical protein